MASLLELLSEAALTNKLLLVQLNPALLRYSSLRLFIMLVVNFA